MSDIPLLELSHISKRFNAIQALDDVSFQLRTGEVHALVGENGAGKSTLMRILAGIYADYEGEYLLEGQQIRLHTPKEALEHGIGMIHQELSVIPELSVAENLFLGRQPRSRLGIIDWKEMQRAAREELAKVGFEHIDVRQALEKYPLGIHQVIEVFRVIFSGARILIMDEPTSALSPAEVERLVELINLLRQQKRTIVYISHFLEEVIRVSDRITVLRDGHNIATLNKAETNTTHLITLILGREASAALPPAITKDDRHVLLEVKDLSADVFTDINIQIRAGAIVGLYGPVGAGHFDVARAIFGLYRFDRGTISVEGRALPVHHSARHAIRRGIAYAAESRRKSLFMDEPIYVNVTLPHLAMIAALWPRPSVEVKAALPVIKRLGVQPPNPYQAVGTLSGGNQQKVALARWLTFPPRIFIVSEPTRGMDVGAKREVLGILRDLRNEGYGILIVSSEPETILSASDEIMTMARGRLTAHLENKNIDSDALMRLV